MAHEYECAVMTQYLTPVKLGGSPDFSSEPAQLGLTDSLRKLTNKLPNAIDAILPEKGWEINSHSLTLAGETVIVSILLQRHHK